MKEEFKDKHLKIKKDENLRESFQLQRILSSKSLENETKIALYSMGDTYSWKTLKKLSDRLASHYIRIGLSPGDIVASFMTNTAELYIHYLACFKANLISVPINHRYHLKEISQVVEIAMPQYIILCPALTSQEMYEAITNIAPHIIVIWSHKANSLELSLTELICTEVPTYSFPKVNPQDPSIIYFTSGSTGNPKGVTHTYHSLGFIISSITQAFQLTSKDKLLPATHFGTYLFVIAALAIKATIILPQSINHKEVLSLLREHRPSIFGMLPADLLSLLEYPEVETIDFSNLRLALSGGDKVNEHVAKKFKEITGLELLEGYGMTEFGISHNNPIDGTNKVGSLGKALPGYMCSVRNTKGEEVTCGKIGELWVKSEGSMIGYWKNEVATSLIAQDGWLKTGDLVYEDSEGYYWFCGRKKQIIVSRGSNVYPQEIEEVLLQHIAIRQAAVFGIDDELLGEKIIACISKSHDQDDIIINEVKTHCSAYLANYKVPHIIIVLDKIPITKAGKSNRLLLRSQFTNGAIKSRVIN